MEDADTTGDDHMVDALRYLCKERLLEGKWEDTPPVFNKGRVRLDAYIQKIRKENRRATV
jgi:hypothetical protein